MKTAITTPPVAESAQWTHESERVYLDGVCVAVSQHKADTIAQGMSAHAAAQQRIAELQGALERIINLYVSGYLKPEADGHARFDHALKQARLALRHPERT